MYGAIQSLWPGWEHGCKIEMKMCVSANTNVELLQIFNLLQMLHAHCTMGFKGNCICSWHWYVLWL